MLRQRHAKWLFSLLCASLLVLAGSACSEAEDEGADAEDGATDGAPDPEEDDGEEAAPEEAEDDDVAAFYEDAELRFIVPVSPGGSFDMSSRVVAEHLPRFLPGNPDAVVENMPGGRHLLAMNAVYGREPQDGTVLMTFHPDRLVDQAIGTEAVVFDGAQYRWLGSLRGSETFCHVRADHEVESIEDVINGAEVFLGSSGPVVEPIVLNRVLETNFDLITGYEGLAEVFLGLEGGEVDGTCVGAENVLILERLDRDPPLVRPLVGLTRELPPGAHQAYHGVPLIYDMDIGAENEALLDMVTLPGQIFVPFVVGPDVPEDRVAALRAAFHEMANDPEFMADYEATGQALRYRPWDEVEEAVGRILGAPGEVIAEVREILSGLEE